MCTTRFNIPKLYILFTECISVFCIILMINNDYFPNFNQLVSVVETCEVWTEFLYII
jgi:hypothetical protein